MRASALLLLSPGAAAALAADAPAGCKEGAGNWLVGAMGRRADGARPLIPDFAQPADDLKEPGRFRGARRAPE